MLLPRGRRLAALVALAALVSPLDAAANGVFPSSGHLLFDPSDPQTAWLRTYYGVVVTRDGGASWNLVCMQAIGYELPTAPSLALTLDGDPYLGLPDGMVRGWDGGCTYVRVESLEGQRVEDVSQTPLGPAYAVVTMDPQPHRVYRSDDGAVTWEPTPSPLPLKFLPITLDAAPSNPERLYVSGLTGPIAQLVGTFARSSDGGATFDEVLVPGSTLGTSPYIAAVDPADDLRVYVRLDSAPGQLLVTNDGGDNWDVIFTGAGFLRGFALSPDGSTAWVGGEADGVWRASAPDWQFEQVSTGAIRCLRSTEDALYACMLPSAGYAIGKSLDGGATFEPFYVESCLAGPLGCDASSTVGAECPEAWPAVAQQLSVTDCAGEGGGGGGAATASSASGATASAASSTAAGAGGASSSGGPETGGDGCDCASSLPGRPPGATAAWGVLLAFALLRLRRRPP